METVIADLALDARAQLGEGPTWDSATKSLIWLDILADELHRFDPVTGKDETTKLAQPVGAIGIRKGGGLVAAARDGFAYLEGGDLKFITNTEADNPKTRMNDGKVDPNGRFWAGTMAYDSAPRAGALYRLDADGSAKKMLSDVTISNGMDWSSDGKKMYFIDSMARGADLLDRDAGSGSADSRAHGVDVFDYDAASGSISNRRRLTRVGDGDDIVPDGMTLDEEGCLWVALWGGSAVNRYDPKGFLIGTVLLPVSNVTSCAFGGADYRDLYITSATDELTEDQKKAQPHAGSIFVCRPGVAGRPANLFAG